MYCSAPITIQGTFRFRKITSTTKIQTYVWKIAYKRHATSKN